MAAGTTAVPSRVSRWSGKTLLWWGLLLAAVWVLVTSELPLLWRGTMYDSYRAQLIRDRMMLLPHALGGLTALLVGPLQFSSRLRARMPKLHRVLGRVYVCAVLLGAVGALRISWHRDMLPATAMQAGTWVICTVAAFVTARNRQIAQHKQWMVRSYAVTFTFISVRILDPWPKYWNLSDATMVVVIIGLTLASVVLADLGMSWRELTMRASVRRSG